MRGPTCGQDWGALPWGNPGPLSRWSCLFRRFLQGQAQALQLSVGAAVPAGLQDAGSWVLPASSSHLPRLALPWPGHSKDRFPPGTAGSMVSLGEGAEEGLKKKGLTCP